MLNDYPLITAAAFVTGVTPIISLLASFGVRLTPEQSDAILKIVAFVAPWVVVIWGHRKTTPLSKPTDEVGQPLVRAVDGMPTAAAVRSMAKK